MSESVRYPDVSVIILAGGKGKRMQSSTPKQYMEINNKKVVEYSIDKFYPLVKELRVIVPDLESAAFIRNLYPDVVLSPAHDSRITSLLNEVSKIKTKYVLVHDASRPFVTLEIIDKVVEALEDYACAYPVVPLSSSVVVDEAGLLSESPNRDLYKEVQTPQGFHTSVLGDALENFGTQHIHIPELVRMMGKKVKHVSGSPWLFKITYAPDIHAAEYYIKHMGWK